MSGFEWNKIFGAILGTLLVVTSIGHIADGLVHVETPEKRGYEVEVASNATQEATQKKEEVLPSILPLLANASAESGASIFKKCTACHSVDEGGPNKVGPNLWNVVNKSIGSHNGFTYSTTLTTFGTDEKKVWNYDNLNAFLYKPKKWAKGTKMNFVGLKKEKDRADVIMYLRSLSNQPAGIPEAAPATE